MGWRVVTSGNPRPRPRGDTSRCGAGRGGPAHRARGGTPSPQGRFKQVCTARYAAGMRSVGWAGGGGSRAAGTRKKKRKSPKQRELSPTLFFLAHVHRFSARVHLPNRARHVPGGHQDERLPVPGGGGGRWFDQQRCAVFLGPGQRRRGRGREKLPSAAAAAVRVLGVDRRPADVRRGVLLFRYQYQTHLRRQGARPVGGPGCVRGVRVASSTCQSGLGSSTLPPVLPGAVSRTVSAAPLSERASGAWPRR